MDKKDKKKDKEDKKADKNKEKEDKNKSKEDKKADKNKGKEDKKAAKLEKKQLKGKKEKKPKEQKDKKKPEKLDKQQRKELKSKKSQKKIEKKSEIAEVVAEVVAPNSAYVDDVQVKVKEAHDNAASGKMGAEFKQGVETWQNAGKVIGLNIWRVEKFALVPWPKEQYGKFYNGDSYVILNTYQKGPSPTNLAWDVHFWLGEKTSQDEAGTAAYMTVQLDDKLGGAPVQHREVQEFESELFLGYFQPLGIQILQGGIDSGFRHVTEAVFRNRLLHLKGKKNIRITEVPQGEISSVFNSGDCFVLDTKEKIYVWNGAKSGMMERKKAGELATALRNERKGGPTIVSIEEGDKFPEFWTALGGEVTVGSAEEGGDDLSAEGAATTTKKLFKLSDASGSLTMTEVASGNVSKSLLHPDDVFIFDSGFEIFVWIGKQASANEKKLALTNANEYLKTHNRPLFLPVTRIYQGSENTTFDHLFTK